MKDYVRHGLTNGETRERFLRNDVVEDKKHDGFTNGMGRTDGLGKDDGLINGAIREQALQNGFINGNSQDAYVKGFTNGMGGDIFHIKHLRTPRKKTMKHQIIMTVLIIFAIVCAPFITSFLVNDAPIIIDGLFRDWDEVASISDDIGDVFNSNVDVEQYKVLVSDNNAYLYLDVVGSLLGGKGNITDTIIFLIDDDRLESTGYRVNGLGYDTMIRISGCENEVTFKRQYRYDGSGIDWNSWSAESSRSVALSDDKIEISVNTASGKPIVDAYLIDSDGNIDQFDTLLGYDLSGYLIKQYSVAPDIITEGVQRVLDLQIETRCDFADITSVTLTKGGSVPDENIGEIHVCGGDGVNLGSGFLHNGRVNIPINIETTIGDISHYYIEAYFDQRAFNGDTVRFYIDSPYDISSTSVVKVYQPIKKFSYLGECKSSIEIDGGFDDWHSVRKHCDYSGDINNPNIDVLNYAMVVDDGKASFYTEVQDGIMTGSTLLISAIQETTVHDVTTATNDTSVLYHKIDPLFGEDVLTVTIDGHYKIDVRGQNGKITKSIWSKFIDDEWTEQGTFQAECDYKRVELSIDDFVVSESSNIVVLMSDWKSQSDEAVVHSVTRSTISIPFSEPPAEPLYNASVDYKMTAFWTEEVPTIDGVVNETAWNGVGIYHVNETKSITIYTSMDSENLYVAVISNNDTYQEANDYCAVFIDIGHNETTSPDADDVMIAQAYGGAVSHYVGNGADWTYLTLPDGCNCSSNSSTTDSRVSWEFKIPVVYLNAYGNFNTTDSFVGFGVQIMDGTGYYHTTYPDYYVEGAIPPMYLMPNYWGDLYDGSITDMGAFYTSSTPTIDGTLSTNEWDDADTYTVDLTKDMDVLTMRDDTYVYVAIYSPDDTTTNLGDVGYVYFDCDHDASSNPDANDKMLRNDSNVVYYEGDGSVWQTTTLPTGWSCMRGLTSSYRSYEFRVPISDLNETGGFWQDGDEVGFGCCLFNAGAPIDRFWVWYPDNYYQGFAPPIVYHNKPNTWGDLQFTHIPEVNDVIVLVVCLLVMNVILFGKNRRRDDDG